MERRAVAPLVVLLGALAAAGCGSPAPGPAPAPERRVLLLGFDAADWLQLDALLAGGRLPTFARLRAHGRTAVLVSTPPLVSPMVWTTIATGRQPEDHGILDFVEPAAPGGVPQPVSSQARRVAALWNMFTEAQRPVAVVGWWASSPADAVNGTLISDRVAAQLVQASRPLDPTRDVYPPGAWPALADTLVRAEQVTRAELERFVPVSPAAYAHAQAALRQPAAGAFYRDRNAHLAAILAGTRTHLALAQRLLDPARPVALAAVYFEQIDTVSHLFVRHPEGARAIARAYEEADRQLATLAARVPGDTLVVVCSDHGFHAPDAGISEDPAQLAGPATAWHRPYGVLALALARDLVGPPVEPSRAGAPARSFATPLDVAPTVLHAAGLPVGLEMPGRVLVELLPPEIAGRPPRRAATAPRPGPAAGTAPAPAAPDSEALARLQALGYLGGAPSSLGHQNLGESLYRRGRLEAAERELRTALEAQPDNLAARLWLARCLADQGRPLEALKAYGVALGLPAGRESALLAAVELALRHGQLATAREWSQPPAGAAQAAPAAVESSARALLAVAEGRESAAERELRSALRREPAAFDALAALFDLLQRQRRSHEFAPLADRAVAAAPRSARLLALQGAGLLAAGDPARAESVLTQALGLAPDGDSVRQELARAQLLQGRPRPALATLAPLPESPERQALEGAAHAALEDWPRAAARYRAALVARPRDAPLLNGLAWAELRLGRKPEAVELLRRSLALQRDQPEIQRLLQSLAGAAGGA